ncbi:MAG TPA: SDR family oxidoreductase [Thermoleophilaceae bacterium]|jgi:NADP-dependent 3-hydroxy acid dehydrogenase YdfG|nr:SDR family oxidoreductase [Thermoleophilaceae bacterium]
MTDQRTLLITGASTGIGAATARAAVASGWQVVLSARSEDKLRALADELGSDKTLVVRCDVTEWDDQQRLVAEALDRFGGIDAAFANAGFGAKRGFLEEDPEFWRSMVLTNVLGPALTIRAVLPHFLERDSGHVLITSSVAGRRMLPGSLYSATKHAATAMGEALRSELRQMRQNSTIRVTLIEPGSVDTPFFDTPPEGALEDSDIAGAVMYALDQPPRVDVSEILIRPVVQPG